MLIISFAYKPEHLDFGNTPTLQFPIRMLGAEKNFRK